MAGYTTKPSALRGGHCRAGHRQIRSSAARAINDGIAKETPSTRSSSAGYHFRASPWGKLVLRPSFSPGSARPRFLIHTDDYLF